MVRAGRVWQVERRGQSGLPVAAVGRAAWEGGRKEQRPAHGRQRAAQPPAQARTQHQVGGWLWGTHAGRVLQVVVFESAWQLAHCMAAIAYVPDLLCWYLATSRPRRRCRRRAFASPAALELRGEHSLGARRERHTAHTVLSSDFQQVLRKQVAITSLTAVT